MPVEFFIRYKGKCYGVGTRLKFYLNDRKHCEWETPHTGKIVDFVGNWVLIKGDDGRIYDFCTTRNLINFDKLIVEIIEPVYYTEQTVQQVYNNRIPPPTWDVEIGWVWYVLIMVVGAIFKDKISIWVFATAYFFLWKNGFFNRKGKN